MPYENYHSCKLVSSDELTNFRQVDRGTGTRQIRVILAEKDGKTVTQGIRYDKRLWKASKARIHCERIGGEFHQ